MSSFKKMQKYSQDADDASSSSQWFQQAIALQ